MGKWSGLRGEVPPAPVDSAWQQKVNIVKTQVLTELPTTPDKARDYIKLRDRKDMLEDEISKLNLRIEALSQLMISELEKDGTNMLRLDSGDSLSIKDEPYSSVEDKPKFIDWINATGQGDLLSVHYMTMSSLVKDRLINGQNPPPGIKVFLKQSITRYKPRG